ncbi:MAG: AraC family transcriptional regulator [Dysgonamonadaceae bacterium]|jgi:AraC-like DNA-binding protein|nr:AraC family transcriptional regulator [Dysgonamonadaceae bacterium]
MEFQNIWENIFLTEKGLWTTEKLSEPVIFFIMEGNIRFTINDTDVYPVDAGEMVLLPAEAVSCKIEALRQSSIMKCALSVESLLVKMKLLEELSFENTNGEEIVKKLPVSEIVGQFLRLLRKCMEKGLVSYYFFDLKRSELNLLLFACYEKEELARFLQPVLSKDIQFRHFVLNNYLKVKNVQELAILANYSTSGFIKKFQKVFDESPYQWMRKQKAAKILIDINRGVKSLQEIANEYKFSSYQHFSVFCKTMFGFSPTDIR